MNILIDIIKLLAESIVEAFSIAINLLKKDHSYKGRYGNWRQILKKRHKQNGIAIGDRFISLKESLNGGMMLLGKTGIGKSSKIFKMLLFKAENSNSSFVNLDVAGDIREDCYYPIVEKFGYKEEILNFSDASKSTVTWNPIEDLPYEKVNRFSNDLVVINMNSENSKDPIWSLMSATLIGIIIRVLKRIDLKEYINLFNTRFLIKVLQSEPKKIDALVSKYADDSLFLNYRAFLNNEDRFLNSVLSNTLAVLQQWEDPNIIKVTSSSSLDMDSYREEKKVLYLQNDVMAQSYLASLNSLFFTSWFSHITSYIPNSNDDNVIVFGIDEASSLKMKKDLIPLVVSQLRKHLSYGIWGYQSYSQVQDLLGFQGAETLRQNTGTILYLGNQDLDTGTRISRSLGRYTYDKEDRESVRELLTPEEAMYLDDSKQGGILFSGQNRPMKLKRIKAFYEIPKYKKWAEMPAKPIPQMHHDMPPLLPIDSLLPELENQTQVNEN